MKIITQKVIHALADYQCVDCDEPIFRIRELVEGISPATLFRG
ncbi:hypothetical protein [Corynebacterium sp. NML180780]|nr:hypothetical protein [Corynebacterium sp. NML180780]